MSICFHASRAFNLGIFLCVYILAILDFDCLLSLTINTLSEYFSLNLDLKRFNRYLTLRIITLDLNLDLIANKVLILLHMHLELGYFGTNA